MAREFLLRGVDPEELKPIPKAEPPKTPQGKWENFWYHYKWHFWGGLFAVVVLVVLVVQMCSRNPADYEVVLVTERALLDSQVAVLEQELGTCGEDLDGDGTVEVNIQNCFLSNPGSQQYYTNQQVLQSRLFAGDVMLFIWEPKYYKEFMKNISSDTAEDVVFLDKLPITGEALAEDGTVYVWNTTSLQKENPAMMDAPKELYCGVRAGSGTASKKTELREACLKLLTAFATGEKTQGE